MSKMNGISLAISIILFPFLYGCNQEEANPPLISNPSDSNIQQIKQGVEDQSTSQEINEHILKKFDSVEDVRSVEHKNEMLIAIQATTFEQFNEQKIETKVKKEIEKRKPNLTIIVSSDQKIFIEVNKLLSDLNTNQLTKKNFDKQFNKIKKLKNDTA